jgi:MoxR-like ATPase
MNDRAAVCFEPTKEPFDLRNEEGWPNARHQFDDESIWAIRAALATGRPLLVRGEPGTGKSQLARAAATALKRPLLYDVINSRTEVTDLLYQFDAVARLAEAQIQGASGSEPAAVQEALAPDKFVRPGKVWWAINWTAAANQAARAGSPIPSMPGDISWESGCVLLIDEIDKADSELPNALLECFANQSFQVPYLKTPASRDPKQPPPLVVVTTNEERELPAPFLRRCFVLHLDLDTNEDRLQQFLIARGRVHFDRDYSTMPGYEEVLVKAAEQLRIDRRSAGPNVVHKPGQAEYLDLCLAVFEIASPGNCGSALEILNKVSKFALSKNQR